MRQRIAHLLFVAVFVVGCQMTPVTIDGTIHTAVPKGASGGGFKVGAATADLTPTPGIPLGGFSIAARYSRGFWTRLMAHAIYAEDDSQNPLVFVSTDLMIMPNALPDRVAELLWNHDCASSSQAVAAPSYCLRHIDRTHMVVAATENHQSPGHFFSSKLYNAYASPVGGGFDPALFEFFARRIAAAIAEAYDKRAPATMHVVATNNVAPGLFRNRALEAFVLNPEAHEYLREGNAQSLESCAAEPGPGFPFQHATGAYPPLACRAVDARIDVIEFVSKAVGTPVIAVAAFTAGHTTVLPSDLEVNAADLFGLTAQRLERGEIPSCAVTMPVVALFNGAQGDVSVTWSWRDRTEVLELSDKLGGAICSFTNGAAATDTTIATRYDEVHPLTDVLTDDPFDRAHFKRTAPAGPKAGVPELGGAADGRTIFYDLGHKDGVRTPRRWRHGSKATPFTIPAGTVSLNLGSKALETDPPPKKAPIGIFRIGETAIVTLPGEATTVMGARIRRLVKAASNPPVKNVILAGFGNGHVSYLTTPEEYEAQYYEGGSNYYGQQTGTHIAEKIEELAKDNAPPALCPNSAATCEYTYSPGIEAAFRPDRIGFPPYFVDDGLDQLVQRRASPPPGAEPGTGETQADFEAKWAVTSVDAAGVSAPVSRLPYRNYPTFCWYDAIPALSDETDDLFAVGACKQTVPEVWIHQEGDANETLALDGVKQDNRGVDIVTVLAGIDANKAEWCSIWLAPEKASRTKTHYFRVRKITESADSATPPKESWPFRLDRGYKEPSGAPPKCDTRMSSGLPGDYMDGGTPKVACYVQRADRVPLEPPLMSRKFWSELVAPAASPWKYCVDAG